MRKENRWLRFNIGSLTGKARCTVVGIFLVLGVRAQTEPRFFIEVDTTDTGIFVGQEVELTYSCTVPFDSVRPPEFGRGIEVVRGPKSRRMMLMRVVDGKKEQVNVVGFSFDVRFLKEGIVDLPLVSVQINGKEYGTPPLSVRIKPAVRDIEGVKCRLTASGPHPGKGETLRVTLFCNRRPDKLSPLLVVGNRKYAPSGKSWDFSSAKDPVGEKSDSTERKETYEFYYNVPSEGGKTFTCSVENLSFGGVSYLLENREIGREREKQEAPSGKSKGVMVVVVIGGILIFGGMWLRFHKESREETAEFVLRYKRLNLGTEWALTHYGFPLLLGSFPFFLLLFHLYEYLVNGRQNLFFHWFWCGLLPVGLALIFWRNQRVKLNFQAVPTSLSKETLREVVEGVARENNWTVDHAGEDCIVARTHPHWWSATRGEQVFMVFDRGQVWINSVNDLNKQSVACSFGYTRKNIRILKKAITERERPVADITG